MANDAAGKVTPDAGTVVAEKPAAVAAEVKTEGTPVVKPAGTDGAAAAGAGGKDGTVTPEPKAPDTYELKVPDGADTYIDDSDIARVAVIAKANGWTNEEAQARLDEHADSIAEMSDGFRKQTESDPVYGGSKLEQTQQHATRALDRMWPKGTDDRVAFDKLLTRSGFGNHRLVIGGLANLGRLMQEDAPASGGPTSGAKRPAEKVLYGGDE